MHRIDGYGATVDNRFTEGDPVNSVPATDVTDDWLNAYQEELCGVIEGLGGVLSKPDNTQLLTALLTHFSSLSRVKEILSVSDNGAVGDNVEDDVAAFNDSIADAVAAGGGKVMVPSPSVGYKTTENISIPNGVILEGVGIPSQKNFALYGAGNPTCSIIKPTGNVSRAIYLQSTRGSGVRNLIIDMAGVTAAGSDSITGISQAYPAVVTVPTPHNRVTGEIVTITDVTGMTEVNDKRYVVTVVDSLHYQLTGVDSTAFSAYVGGGTWTLNPVGLVVDGSWHFDVRNIIAINLPNENCFGVLFIASSQGAYWGTAANLQAYSISGVGKGIVFQGIKPSIGGADNPRVNQIVLSGLRTVNVNDGITCDECGAGLIFLSPSSEGNAGDGFVSTNNSTSGYPTIIGGELNTNGGWGANGLVHLINSVRADGNMGGTGVASADYWLKNGAFAEYLDSSGRLVFDGPAKIKNITTGAGSQLNVNADDTITATHGIMVVGSAGGEVVLTSNPQIAPGYRGQRLTLIGNSNTNFLKFTDGNGLALNAGFLSLKNGDVVELVYFDDVGVSAINNTWAQVPFVIGGLVYSIIEIAADVIVRSNHHFIFMTTAGVNKNATLPLLADVPNGKPFFFFNDDGLNTFTILGNGSNINGAASYVIPATAKAYVEVIKCATEWKVARTS